MTGRFSDTHGERSTEAREWLNRGVIDMDLHFAFGYVTF